MADEQCMPLRDTPTNMHAVHNRYIHIHIQRVVVPRMRVFIHTASASLPPSGFQQLKLPCIPRLWPWRLLISQNHQQATQTTLAPFPAHSCPLAAAGWGWGLSSPPAAPAAAHCTRCCTSCCCTWCCSTCGPSSSSAPLLVLLADPTGLRTVNKHSRKMV